MATTRYIVSKIIDGERAYFSGGNPEFDSSWTFDRGAAIVFGSRFETRAVKVSADFEPRLEVVEDPFASSLYD